MPESGAVYQPTTVGYAYDSAGDGTGIGIGAGGPPGGLPGGRSGIRSGLFRIMSRHNISARKWIEWLLPLVAVLFFVSGLVTIFVNLAFANGAATDAGQSAAVAETTTAATTAATSAVSGTTQPTTAPAMSTSTIEPEIPVDYSRGSLAVGAALTLIGLILGTAWTWYRFFHRNKTLRGGMSSVGGQYGPVLTELPSQPKAKSTPVQREAPANTLSDQEEETRTLMQESNAVSPVAGDANLANRIPG